MEQTIKYVFGSDWTDYVCAVVCILSGKDRGDITYLVPTLDGYEIVSTNVGDDGTYVTMDMVYVTRSVGDRLYREGYVVAYPT